MTQSVADLLPYIHALLLLGLGVRVLLTNRIANADVGALVAALVVTTVAGAPSLAEAGSRLATAFAWGLAGLCIGLAAFATRLFGGAEARMIALVALYLPGLAAINALCLWAVGIGLVAAVITGLNKLGGGGSDMMKGMAGLGLAAAAYVSAGSALGWPLMWGDAPKAEVEAPAPSVTAADGATLTLRR